VSLGTGIFSWTIALFLLSKNPTNTQHNKLIFLLLFSSIQFADAILWWNKMEKNSINYITTSVLIPLILSAQIVCNVYYMGGFNNRYLDIMVLGVIASIFYTLNGYSIPSCNRFGSPKWGNYNIKPYEALLFLFLITVSSNINIYSVVSHTIPLILAYLYMSGLGSGWCAIANIFSIIYLYSYYNKNSTIAKTLFV